MRKKINIKDEVKITILEAFKSAMRETYKKKAINNVCINKYTNEIYNTVLPSLRMFNNKEELVLLSITGWSPVEEELACSACETCERNEDKEIVNLCEHCKDKYIKKYIDFLTKYGILERAIKNAINFIND